MNPYIPYAALPAAVILGWFAAPHFSASDPGRFTVPGIHQIDDPSAQMVVARDRTDKTPDIRVAAFLPQELPKPRTTAPMLILQSVVIGDRINLVTINGRSLQKGEKIDGYVVQRITANGVDLAKGNQVRHLPMKPLHELPPPAESPAGST